MNERCPHCGRPLKGDRCTCPMWVDKNNPEPHGEHHGLLTFTFKGETWEARPYRPFQPSGLAIYGAPPGSTVQVQIGMDREAVVSYAPIPARFFNSDLSFQQIAAKLDEAKEPPNWVTWDLAEPGVDVIVHLLDVDGKPLGPKQGAQLLMWGVIVERVPRYGELSALAARVRR